MIVQLPAHLADLIAAGEVVERPASAAKELLENSLDAGATAITVDLQGGGLRCLRVSDNGCGILPEQLPTAFLRHATSKLRQAEDLASIGTLGFRGEALAAIAAVSRIHICSRKAESSQGAALSLEGGVPALVEVAGCPQGTTITVRDLFFNTPARLKFMKKDSAEAAAVTAMVQHLAISRPDVSFCLIRDGQELLQTPGDGKLQNAVYAALGREFALTLLAVSGQDGPLRCQGLITRPLQSRGSRAMELFFVNERLVKSPLLTAALEEAYRNRLMKGKFPGCVLNLSLPLDRVDVNVHPAKTMVKLLGERQIFDLVFHTVCQGLEQELPGNSPASDSAAVAGTTPRQDFFQSMTTTEYRGKHTAASTPPGFFSAPRSGNRPCFSSEIGTAHPLRQIVRPPSYEATARPVPPPIPAIPRAQAMPVLSPASEPTALPAQQTLLPASPCWRIIGEALHTYILCEAEEGNLWLIDKHAAHERLLFDKLRLSQEPVLRQCLLSPLALNLAPQTCALLLENRPSLEQAGFCCEDFGSGTVLLREIPADLGQEEAASTLEALAEQFSSARFDPALQREALLKTIACKAAVKAGMFSGEAELRVLVDQVQSGVLHHCPHGRPVAVKLSRYELEKMFKRV